MRNLLLPSHFCLSVDLSSRLKLLSILSQQNSTSNDGVVTHDGLVVIYVGSAAGAIVAVDGLA